MHKSRTLTAVALAAALGLAGACSAIRRAPPVPAPTPAAPQAEAGRQGAPAARADAAWIVKDPTDLPDPVSRREAAVVVVDLEARELVGQLGDGITYEYWTFDGTVPGPMIRARVGDAVELRMHNHASSKNPHSIDLHAVNGPGGGTAATEALPGQTGAFRFKALHPGVFIYHCATPFVPAHITQGMYGLIVIEPEDGLVPVDREFYLVQGEVYANLRPNEQGHAKYDGEAVWLEQPNFVVFNGAFKALTGERSMTANVGERVRLFVGNAGPNLISSFHVIGEVFDVVHPEGASEALHNVQVTLIPAGGATWVEFTADVPGTYILLDHSMNRAVNKGAIATLKVTGPDNPDIFEPLDQGSPG